MMTDSTWDVYDSDSDVFEDLARFVEYDLESEGGTVSDPLGVQNNKTVNDTRSTPQLSPQYNSIADCILHNYLLDLGIQVNAGVVCPLKSRETLFVLSMYLLQINRFFSKIDLS